MSTDLYGVRILKTDPSQKKVTLRVFVVYYDVAYKNHQPLPADYSFFLRILRDEGDEGTIGTKITIDEYLDEAWVDANTYNYIDKVVQLSTKNFPLESYEGYYDFYYGDGPWQDEEKLVQADYEVYVTDAAYLDHLHDGMSFGTTSYETNALFIDNNAINYLPKIDEPVFKLVPFTGGQEAGTADLLAFTADGSKLIVSSAENEVACFDTNNWRELWRTDNDGMFAYMNLDDAQGIVWLSDYNFGKLINVMDIATGQKSGKLPVSTARVTSPRGTYHVNFGEEDKLSFADTNGNEINSIPQPDTVEAVAFSPDEKYVAIGGMFKSISIYDVQANKELLRIDTKERTTGLAFNADGQYLAVVYFNAFEIFDVKTGQKVFACNDAKGNYFGKAAWSPDGIFFAINQMEYNGYGGFIGIYAVGQ